MELSMMRDTYGISDYAPSGLNFLRGTDSTGLRPELRDIAPSGLCSLPGPRSTGLSHALGNITPSGLIFRRIRIPPGFAQG